MIANASECVFCAKFGGASASEGRSFDKIIWGNEDFVLVPGLGSLVPGYLLIMPREHYESIARLPSQLLSELSKVQSAVREVLRESFLEPVFFEHGIGCESNRAGSCIDHAHIHCAPLETDLTSRLEASHALTAVNDLPNIAEYLKNNESYIYFENQRQERFIIRNPRVPSQYVRRLIAESLGIPSQWDWAVFRFEKNLLSTLAVSERLANELQRTFEIRS